MVSAPTLAAKIVSKGLDNMDFSMLPPQVKFEILTLTGELFFKRNMINDALRAFMIASNMDRLLELGNWLLLQGRFEDAARFFMQTGHKKLLEKVGFKCAEAGNYELAFKCFEASGNLSLAEFMYVNFLHAAVAGP